MSDDKAILTESDLGSDIVQQIERNALIWLINKVCSGHIVIPFDEMEEFSTSQYAMEISSSDKTVTLRAIETPISEGGH